jgi:hypothetical protein
VRWCLVNLRVPGKRTARPGRTAERVGFFTTLPFVWWAPWTQIPWFLTGLAGNLVSQFYRGGGWKRLHIRPS